MFPFARVYEKSVFVQYNILENLGKWQSANTLPEIKSRQTQFKDSVFTLLALKTFPMRGNIFDLVRSHREMYQHIV